MFEVESTVYTDMYPDINVADVGIVEGAAGPGKRLVLWLQGCLKRCPGCANQAFLPVERRSVIPIGRILELMTNETGLSGITLSGGEPILQARAITPLLVEARSRGLNVVCYTGYTLEDIRRAHSAAWIAKFLEQIDLMIDGEYRSELPGAGKYRPSSNQRLHFLTDRIAPESCRDTPDTTFSIDRNGAAMTGTLPSSISAQIFERLRAYGVIVRPEAD